MLRFHVEIFKSHFPHQHTTRAHCSDQTGSPIKNSQRIFETFHQRRHSDSHCSLREPSPCRLRDPGVLMSVEGVPGHRFESSSSASTHNPTQPPVATTRAGIRHKPCWYPRPPSSDGFLEVGGGAFHERTDHCGKKER